MELIISAMKTNLLRRNIEHLMQIKDWGQSELSRRSGVPQPTIQRLLKEVHGEPRRSTIEKLAAAFDVNTDDLYSKPLYSISEDDAQGVGKGHEGSDSGEVAQLALLIRNARQLPIRPVPLLSWGQVVNWVRSMNLKNVTEFRKIAVDVSERAFLLVQEDDSMFNPSGFPSIPKGVTLVVDPAIQPANQKIVIALPRSSDRPVIGRLVDNGIKKYLEPLNPRYPIIEIDNKTIFLGVVKTVQFDV